MDLRFIRTSARAGTTSPVVVALLCALAVPGCKEKPTEPDPILLVTPIESSGPVRIAFVSATIAPGETVTGCGSLIEGCAGMLRMTLRLDPPSNGPVLFTRIYLHATNQIACLWGDSAPFDLQAGIPRTIDISFGRADRCQTPTTIATMAAVVEGPSQVASRQTWSLHYVFAP